MKTRLRRSFFLAGASLIACIGLAAPAAAQDDPAASDPAAQQQPAATEDDTDIVVTALRRDQNLQDVPAAITAFTDDAIEAAGIERPLDFINLTSNVNLVETQNAGNAFIVIRGITQARNSEPSVAVIVDGIQQVNPAQFNQELFDIEQIEVLKGPQGAVYGRNAIGGAIVIRTKQPSDAFEGQIRAGVDNGFSYWLRGGVSGPISDTLRFRVAASWLDSEGFLDNPFLGEKADPVEDFSVRGTLLWNPSPEFTVDLRGSLSRLRTQALYFNIVADANDTSLPIRVNNAGQNDRDMENVSLRLNWETGSGTLSSVTSYDTLSEVLTGDAFDFLPIPESFFFNLFEFLFGPGNGFDLNQSQFLEVEAISQEIRWTSPAERRFRYIVGAYAIDTNRFISTGNMIDTGNGVFPVFREPSTNPLNPQFTFLADRQNNFAWSVFGNFSYDFSEQLSADLGLRYDHDRRRNTTLTPTAFLPNVPGFPQGATGDVRRISFDDWQPKLTLTWEPSSTVTIYGGYSRGFRSGGFNQTGVGASRLRQRNRRSRRHLRGRDRRDLRDRGAHVLPEPAADAGRQRLYDADEEQLFLRLPRGELNPESRQRPGGADTWLRARGDGEAGEGLSAERGARLYQQQDHRVSGSDRDRQRASADLALHAQPRRAVSRTAQRNGSRPARPPRLSPHRPDLVGALQHDQPRSDRPGQRPARRGGRQLVGDALRGECVRRRV